MHDAVALKLIVASRGSPCDSVASCLTVNVLEMHDGVHEFEGNFNRSSLRRCAKIYFLAIGLPVYIQRFTHFYRAMLCIVCLSVCL